MSVDGLETEVELEEVIEGGRNDYVHRLPKQIKYSNVKLKRGMEIDGEDKLAKALSNFLLGPKPFSAENFGEMVGDVVITLLNPRKQKRKSKTISSKTPLVQWTLSKAYPVKWSLNTLDALEESVLFEELELAFTSISVEYLYGASQNIAPVGKTETENQVEKQKKEGGFLSKIKAGAKAAADKAKEAKAAASEKVKESENLKKVKALAKKAKDLKEKADDKLSALKKNVDAVSKKMRRARGQLKKIQKIADRGVAGQIRDFKRATGLGGLLRQVDGLSKQTKDTTESVNKSIFSLDEQIEEAYDTEVTKRWEKYKKNAETTGKALTEADKPEDIKKSEEALEEAEETRDELEEKVLELEDAMESLENQKEAVEQQIAEMEEEDEEASGEESDEEGSGDEDDKP